MLLQHIEEMQGINIRLMVLSKNQRPDLLMKVMRSQSSGD